ncbi:uncharacterized protein JN550_012204 [Neoarthrinium moseri]|uniref:uncharacterized protein n=1 Tax=Neoarthrinium moseri TaxID=1658444 RepID=UPI001FDC6E32|nr:uncharacterized protein JN550_012204 [Neoarthrinium moseri]KAI1859191.1 hypothetical protein JN550_012204 [Neoarthrinium moseri]
MGSNATEVEQMLLELLSALNSKLNGSDSSEEDNSLATTANRLALAATVIAVAAFFTSALQALLEYAGAGESARQKCNFPAIGLSSNLVLQKWSFLRWRRKFYYPQLNLSIAPILRNLNVDKKEGQLTWLFRGLLQEHPDYYWGIRPIWQGQHSIVTDGSRGLACAIEGSQRQANWVSPEELPWKYWLIWRVTTIIYKPFESNQPRASWAQFLAAFDISTYEPLVEGKVDAECIPLALDVPTQQAHFFHLGVLAFTMGLSDVRISAERREFKAVGDFGSITTEDVSGFGRVVRFQNNSSRQRCTAAIMPGAWQLRMSQQVTGAWYFGWHVKREGESLSMIMDCLERGNEPEAEDLEYANTISLTEEARITDDLGTIPPPGSESAASWLVAWRELVSDYEIRWPSIVCASSIACLPALVTGFPHQIMLKPFTSVFRLIAEGVRVSEGDTFHIIWNHPLDTLRSVLFQGMFKSTRREPPGTVEGLSGWAFCNEYTCTEVWGLLTPLDQNLDGTGCQKVSDRGIIFPVMRELLHDFDVPAWQEKFKRRHAGTRGQYPKPEHLTWLQVYLIDAELQQILRELRQATQHAGPLLVPGPGAFDWAGEHRLDIADAFSVRILKAIWAAWSSRPREYETRPLESLEDALETEFRNNKVDLPDLKSQLRRLADLLRLRALFFAAYMMVIPDSTDFWRFYETKTLVALPMI